MAESAARGMPLTAQEEEAARAKLDHLAALTEARTREVELINRVSGGGWEWGGLLVVALPLLTAATTADCCCHC